MSKLIKLSLGLMVFLCGLQCAYGQCVIRGADYTPGPYAGSNSTDRCLLDTSVPSSASASRFMRVSDDGVFFQLNSSVDVGPPFREELKLDCTIYYPRLEPYDSERADYYLDLQRSRA